MQQRPAELSGDYAYDLVHEQTGDRGRAPEARRGELPRPTTEHRRVDLDQDISYDEAHDF